MFRFTKFRQALLGAMAIPMLVGIQGCNDRDALAAAGTIAVVGGAVAIGSAYSDGYYRNDGYYYNDGRYYRGPRHYDGYYYNNGRYYRDYRGYHRPPYRGGWHGISANSDSGVDYSHEEKQVEELNSAALMASHYNIPITAAQTLTNTLKQTVEGQTLQPMYELGLSQADFQSLSQAQGISTNAIDKMSEKLNLSKEQTQTLVHQMMTDVLNSKNAEPQTGNL